MILDRKYPWPAWHPDTELRAEDLIGLEAYLLTRSTILDEDAIGIEQISDWEQSIQFAWNAQAGTLTVRDIQGITPSGQPIVLAKDNLLVHEVRDLSPGASVDAWISVNNRCLSSSKLTLDVTPAVDDSWVSETTAHDNLYLGRYKLPHPENGSLVLERHPVCRRLCAFGPLESLQWSAWVEPLSSLIEQLVVSTLGQTNRSVVSMTIGFRVIAIALRMASAADSTIGTAIANARLAHVL